MNNITKICVLLSVSLCAYSQECSNCCEGYGGIAYNDSSSGRYVCRNGYFSNCYGTRHAVMDMQKFKGCCIWEGGIEKITLKGEVICRDGHVSEICTLQNPNQTAAVY
jgi:hypothetical protein